LLLLLQRYATTMRASRKPPKEKKMLYDFNSQRHIKPGELSTLGYTEDSAQERLDAFIARPGTALVDIRMSPSSRRMPTWSKADLMIRYPARYIWVAQLGNINYRPKDRKKGIELYDAAEGVAMVTRLLRSGHSVMLLCACKDYQKCHRKVVYELVMQALESEKSA
jgi:uncharacterized protein (DUF488 family)